MGKRWSVPPVAVWRELLRVLRPGAHVLATTGTKTQDLVSVGIRAAGFEIRDAISDWCYASGFPKNLDISKAIDAAAGAEREVVGTRVLQGRAAQSTKEKGGTYTAAAPSSAGLTKEVPITAPATEAAARWDGYGTALKPAREPIIVACKPLDGTYAHNALTHGVGGINIDGCRIGAVGFQKPKAAIEDAKQKGIDGSVVAYGHGLNAPCSPEPIPGGRWPANLVLTHVSGDEGCRLVGTRKVATGVAVKRNGVTGQGTVFAGTGIGVHPVGTPDATYAGVDGKEEVEAWECVEGCPVAELDRQSGDRPGMSGGGAHRPDYDGSGKVGNAFGGVDSTHTARGDSGGASRFFFCAKASSAERTFGCEKGPWICGDCERTGDWPAPEHCPHCNSTGVRPVAHPTVKPLKLCKWEATLVLPPPRADGQPRRILVIYAGVGSEMIGALRAGWDEIVGIQRGATEEEKAYVTIARMRLARWAHVSLDMDEEDACAAGREERKAIDRGQMGLF